VQLAGTSCSPTLTLNGFADLVRTELSDRRPNFATFQRWPPEPMYREVAEHSDQPDELLDPSWCPPV